MRTITSAWILIGLGAAVSAIAESTQQPMIGKDAWKKHPDPVFTLHSQKEIAESTQQPMIGKDAWKKHPDPEFTSHSQKEIAKTTQQTKDLWSAHPKLSAKNYQPPKDADDGGKDEAEAFVKEIETRIPINITQVPDIPQQEFKHLKSNAKGEKWMIRRMTFLQRVVLLVRNSYQQNMRDQASWTCRWYEVHKPEYFGCVALNFVNLVEEDCRNYPGEVLLKIRTAKEAYIKSRIHGIPIKKVNADVFTDTNYYLNGLIPEIRTHRDDLVGLLKVKMESQMETIKVSCRLPLTNRHGENRNPEKDKHYTMYEDYSPHDYNKL